MASDSGPPGIHLYCFFQGGASRASARHDSRHGPAPGAARARHGPAPGMARRPAPGVARRPCPAPGMARHNPNMPGARHGPAPVSAQHGSGNREEGAGADLLLVLL